MRLLITVFMLFLIPACAPVIKPMGSVKGLSSLTDKALVARDGAVLPVRSCLPQRRPRAVIIALHGFNDYANAIALPAPFWAEQGIATYAYDQRGFGGAPNRGYWAGTRTMTADLRDAVRAVRQRHPQTPLFVLGVSMGGAVVMAALADAPIAGITGVVLIEPAVWGRDHMNIIQRTALWIFSNTIPWYPLTSEGLNIKPSDNIEMLRALSRDPKIIRETRIDAIKGLVDSFNDLMSLMENKEITYTGSSHDDRPMKVTKEDGKWQMEQTEAGEVSGIVSGGENKIEMEDYPSNWIINGTWEFSKSGNKCQINHTDDKDLEMYWKC